MAEEAGAGSEPIASQTTSRRGQLRDLGTPPPLWGLSPLPEIRFHLGTKRLDEQSLSCHGWGCQGELRLPLWELVPPGCLRSAPLSVVISGGDLPEATQAIPQRAVEEAPCVRPALRISLAGTHSQKSKKTKKATQNPHLMLNPIIAVDVSKHLQRAGAKRNALHV